MSNEKEKNMINDKVKKNGDEKSEVAEKSRKSDFVDVKDYFEIEFVDGELIFACNVCNEGVSDLALLQLAIFGF